MKQILMAFLIGLTGFGITGRADDKKAKPYPFKTCLVSGEEISDKGAMKPHTFVHEGQEIRLCCKACLKDFNKNKTKYLKKIEDASAKKS